MDNKILLDENGVYKFDFSNCEYVLELHDLANRSKLNDVDFITELNDEVLFIEYKNANIPNAIKPDAMFRKIKENPEKFYSSIAKKYYDSLFILWACNGNKDDKKIAYILLIEDKKIDEVMRKKLKIKIKKQLPFNLKDENVVREILSRFEVYNLKEWNREFSDIKIFPVE